MDAKQFAWLYLIKHGYAGVAPSYYGGWDVIDHRLDKIKVKEWESNKPYADFYMAEIHQRGVDWSKTDAPRSTSHSSFEGTFADSSEKEYLEGVLYLTDGTKQHWCARDIEVTNVFEMMANVHNAANEFKRVFGHE